MVGDVNCRGSTDPKIQREKRFSCLLTVVNVMSLSPPDASQGSAAKTLIKFIRTSWPIALCSVKLTMSSVLILKNETVVVTCAVSTGPIESRPPMLLNQTLNDLIRDRLVSQKHQWLSEVTISFLSLVVCVRKRNGSLRLRRLLWAAREDSTWPPSSSWCSHNCCEFWEQWMAVTFGIKKSLSLGKVSCTWN